MSFGDDTLDPSNKYRDWREEMQIQEPDAVIFIVRCYPKPMPEGGMVMIERQNWRPLELHRDVVSNKRLGEIVGEVLGNMVEQAMR